MLAASPPPLIRHLDQWYTLAALGHQGRFDLTEDQPVTPDISYQLPQSSGATAHLEIRLVFRVILATGSRGGFGYLDADTGHGTSASVEFKTDARRGHNVIFWNTVDVRGEQRYVTKGRTLHGAMTNYVLSSDELPGVQHLRFRLERYAGLRVARAEVLASTGVRTTGDPPYTLRISAVPARVRGRGGLGVAISLLNIGREPVRRLRVHAFGAGLTVENPGVLSQWTGLPPHRLETRVVRLYASLSSPQKLTVVAESDHGSGETRVGLSDAHGDRHQSDDNWLVWAGRFGGGVLALSLGATAFKRRSHRIDA